MTDALLSALLAAHGNGRIDPASDPVAWFAHAFMQQKILFERASLINSDAIHVLVGVGLQILAAILLRRSLANIWPWLIVLAMELANEVNDVVQQVWPVPAMQLGESLKDIGLTMAVPTLLWAMARFAPAVLVRRKAPAEPVAADETEWLPELDDRDT